MISKLTASSTRARLLPARDLRMRRVSTTGNDTPPDGGSSEEAGLCAGRLDAILIRRTGKCHVCGRPEPGRFSSLDDSNTNWPIQRGTK